MSPQKPYTARGPKRLAHFISGEKYEAVAKALEARAEAMRQETQEQLDSQVGQIEESGIVREGYDRYYDVIPKALELTARRVRGANDRDRLNRCDVVGFTKESAREAWNEAKPALIDYGFDNNDIVNAAAADTTTLGQMCQDVFSAIARGTGTNHR